MIVNTPILDISDQQLLEMYEFIQVALGGEDIDVDITKKEVRILARKALRDYYYEIQVWQTRNQFSNIVGSPTSINGITQDFTNRFIYDNGMIAQRISDWFAAMARVGGKVTWKKDYIQLVPGKQVYDLAAESSIPYQPGTRRIHKVMWYARPEIFGNTNSAASGVQSADFIDNSLFTFGMNGLAYNGNSMGFLGNLFDVVLLGQALESRNKVLRSEFFYNISGDMLEVTPMPGGHSLAVEQGAKVFYYYFDEGDPDFYGPSTASNTQSESGGLVINNGVEDLICNPTQVKIDTVPYSQLNAMAQNWVENYTLALAKHALGSKWRRIKTIASPNSDYQVELDYASLLDEYKAMVEELKTKLNENLLVFLDSHTMMENKASQVENAAKINKNSPRKWFLGMVASFLSISAITNYL